MWNDPPNPPNDEPNDSPFPSAMPGTSDDPVDDLPDDRAARRFHQIHRHERAIAALDKKISDAKTKLSTLKEERDGVVAQLLAAARDEGELPLFNL